MRAKLVKTRAQINEVLDDRSLIKKLQKELAMAKMASGGVQTASKIQLLESEAAEAGKSARDANNQLARLKAAILKGGIFQPSFLSRDMKRRRSDIGRGGNGSPLVARARLSLDNGVKRHLSGGIWENNEMKGLMDVNNFEKDLVQSPELTITSKKFLTDKKRVSKAINESPSFQVNLFREALVSKRNTMQLMEQSLSVEQIHKMKLSKSNKSLQEEITSLTTELALLKERNELCEAVANQMSAAEDERLSEVQQLRADLSNEEMELQETIETNNSLQDQMNSLTSEMAVLKDSLGKSSTDNEVLKERNELCEAVANQMSAAEDERLSEVQQLRSRLQTSQVELQKKQKLDQTNHNLLDQVSSLTSEMSVLKESLAKTVADNKVLKEQHELSQVISNQMSTAEDERLSEMQQLRSRLQTSQVELQKKESNEQKLDQTNHDLLDQVSSLTSEMSVLKESLAKTVADNEVLKEQHELSQVISNQLSEAEKEKRSELQELRTRLNTVCSEVEERKQNESTLLEKNQGLQNELTLALTNVNSLIEDHDALQVKLEAKELSEGDIILNYNEQLDRQSSVITNLEETIMAYKQKTEELESKKELSESISFRMSGAEDEALADVEYLTAEINDLHAKLDTAQNELQEKKVDASHLTSKNKSLQGQMIDLSTEISDLHEKLQESLKEYEDLEERHGVKVEELHTLRTEKGNLEIKLEESLKEIKVLGERNGGETEELHVLKTKKENLENCLKKTNDEMRELMISYEVEIKKQSDASKEMEFLKKELSQYQTHPPKQLDEKHENELCAEMNELKLLLASSNKREEEAETIVVAAEKEIEEKEREIEELIKIASDRDTVAKEMEGKVTLLQNQLLSSSTQDHDQLLRHDMELLMEEKLALEDRLDAEIESRITSGKELKEQMGGEQRELVRQAEVKMSSLRDELAALKRDSEHHRMNAQRAKQEVELLKKSIEDKKNESIASNQVIADLKATLDTVEQSFSDISRKMQNTQDEYDAFKKHAALTKDNIKSNSNSKLNALREELQKFRETLHEKEEETQSAKNKLGLYKDQANQLQRELEATKQTLFVEKDLTVSKLKEEISKGKVNVARSEAEVLSYKQEVHVRERKIKKLKIQYNDIISKTKEEKKVKMSMMTEIELLQDNVKALEKNIEKLKSSHSEGESEVVGEMREDIEMMASKIKSKDERIKSLHSKVLTKDQVAKIKALKVSEVNDYIRFFLVKCTKPNSFTLIAN
jgi:chromosome segregation ATPase